MRPFNASNVTPVPWEPWPSPVTPELMTSAAPLGLSEVQVDGDAIYWLEQRPLERGRQALVRWTPAAGARDAVGPEINVGTRVHEYGGGGYAVRDGTIIGSSRDDGSVWLIEGDGPARTIVRVPDVRLAAFTLDLRRRRAYAVREDHRDRPFTNPANAIVALDLDPADAAANAGSVLFDGSDFVLAPALSPDGERLAFVAWDHPSMPWDATTLYVGTLAADGRTLHASPLAGGDDEAIVEPTWLPDGTLVFASDRTNWWNLYALRDGEATALAPMEAENAQPAWMFGRPAIAPLGDGRLLTIIVRSGTIVGGLLDGGAIHPLPFGLLDVAPVPYGDGAVFVSVPLDRPASVRLARSLDEVSPVELRAAGAPLLPPEDVSVPEMLVVPTSDGETTHVTFFPPRNAQVTSDEPPPLLVMSHGGPTAMYAAAYSVNIQFWTTRGFAVAHVNYRGSTGFGRAYRMRLNGAWGVVDVIDCVSTAQWLAANGRCNPDRMVIRGGSASGMTALLAVATSDAFRAATSLYGVTDLRAITVDSHKFELRYTDGLVGPLPEAEAIYRERSPVNRVDTIDADVLLLQGLEDRVVPVEQATSMRDALAARGVRVVYEAFEGEGHGFRQATTMRRVLEIELDFYRNAFARA